MWKVWFPKNLLKLILSCHLLNIHSVFEGRLKKCSEPWIAVELDCPQQKHVHIFGPPGTWNKSPGAMMKLCSGTSFRTQLLCPTSALTEAYRLAGGQCAVDTYDGGAMMQSISSESQPRFFLTIQ